MLLPLLFACSLTIDTDTELDELGVFTKVDNESDAAIEFADDLDTIRLECPDGIERDVDLYVNDGTLVIHAEDDPDHGRACLVRIPGPDVHSITVRGQGEVGSHGTMRSLELVDVRGGGSVHLDTVVVDEIELVVAGNGSLTIDWLEADWIGAEIKGTGDMYLAGVGGHLDLRISGSGSLMAEDLVVETLDAELTGSGSATVTVTGNVDADVRGNGTLVTGQ